MENNLCRKKKKENLYTVMGHYSYDESSQFTEFASVLLLKQVFKVVVHYFLYHLNHLQHTQAESRVSLHDKGSLVCISGDDHH